MALRHVSRPWLKLLGVAGKGLLTGEPVPLLASLEVTRRCRRSCRYCASSRDGGDPELSLSAWAAVLEDLARSGTVAVSITGGEPLERADVVGVCDRARALGLFVGLNTNGMMLPERREILSRVDRLTLSLDGPREVNDAVRGSGAFDAVQDAIALAREAGVPVSITAVLSARSVGWLDELLSWAADHRVPVLFQPAYDHLLRSEDLPNPERPDDQALQEACARILAAKEAGVPVENSRAGLRWMLGQDGPHRCRGGQFFVRVTASGEVQVCGLSVDPSPPGIRASEGIVEGMKQVRAATGRCGRCESAVRAELNLLAAPSLQAWRERIVGTLRRGVR